MLRVLDVIDNQVRDLRKRQADRQLPARRLRKGTYWGIRSDVARLSARRRAALRPYERPACSPRIPTRLKRLTTATQERLINWGYAICDTALRKWVIEDVQPGRLPYPHAGFG